MSEGFYIQDQRKSDGNSMVWWKRDNHGYSINLKEARVFTLLEISKMHSVAEGEKKAWPKAYIDARIQPHVVMQSCDDSEAWQP